MFMEMLVNRLQKAFNLTRDLAQGLSQDELTLRLADLPSNSIGQQLWCIIGARESYLRAMMNSGWSGFTCSLEDAMSRDMVLTSLEDSSVKCLQYLAGRSLSVVQTEFLVALLEHEVQHHGQLIRYVYANKLAFPQSWTDRYTV